MAATWLGPETAAGLSTVRRYAYVEEDDLDAAGAAIAARLSPEAVLRASGAPASFGDAVRSEAGTAAGDGRAPAPSGSKETAERLPDPKA